MLSITAFTFRMSFAREPDLCPKLALRLSVNLGCYFVFNNKIVALCGKTRQRATHHFKWLSQKWRFTLTWRTRMITFPGKWPVTEATTGTPIKYWWAQITATPSFHLFDFQSICCRPLNLKPSFGIFVLVYSILLVVKRHHDQTSSYRRKRLTRGCLVSEV